MATVFRAALVVRLPPRRQIVGHDGCRAAPMALLTAVAPAPFAQADWPNPIPRAFPRSLRGITDRSLPLLTAVVVPPFAQWEWPLPRRRASTRSLLGWSNAVLTMPDAVATTARTLDSVFLVEMETGLSITTWVDQAIGCDTLAYDCDSTVLTCAGLSGVYARTLDDDMLVVSKVTQDGTALTEVASAALVDTTNASWYYDVATRGLRVHLINDVAYSTAIVVVAIVLETLAHATSVTLARSTGTALTWDGRVAGLPSISQSVVPDELGAGSVATLGALSLANEDGRYDRLFAERIVNGLDVRIYRGREQDVYAAFTLWLTATMHEPEAGADRATVPLMSLAMTLNQPAITDSFQTTTFPNMAGNITGFNIPKVWGTVVGAEAFRIASGEWKWANHAVTSLASCATADGTAVTIGSTDLTNGTFTVNASYDAEDRLFVNGRGYALDTPGKLITDVVQKLGSSILPASLDAVALATLDAVRPVKIGFQVRTGSVRDVLDRIARSAFVDYFVDRTNILSARARTRDQGNFVINDDFEINATGWTGSNGATLSRTTSVKFRGAGALEIVKPAAQALAYASASVALGLTTPYVVTLLAALVSGAATVTFRASLTNSAGAEFFSPDTVLSSTRWTRITFTTGIDLTGASILCDSVSVNCDTVAYTCDLEGGAIRVYPQYGGADDVTIAIDDVEVVEAVVLDDQNCEVLSSLPVSPSLWRVRAGYQFDGRTQERRFVSAQDGATQDLYPMAESRTIDGDLVDSTDADAVATAALDYYQIGRTRVGARFLDRSVLFNVGGDRVAYLNTTRRPSVPGDGRLYRLASVDEQHPERGGAEVRLEIEALHDPIFDQLAIVAT